MPAPKDYDDILKDPNRLRVLRDLELVDSPAEAAFDRLTKLASKILGKPVSLVSIVDSDRQFFKSFVGLKDPYATDRETPLSHSFCQHVVATNEPLVVEDARQHPLVHDNLAIPDLDVISYLGMPLTTTDGDGLGSFCVIDSKPHKWTEEEKEIMRELSQAVMTEIELRAELNARLTAEKALRKAYDEIDEQHNRLRQLTMVLKATVNYMAEIGEKEDADNSELLEFIESMRYQLEDAL